MGFVRATVLGLTLCLTAGVPGTAAARGKASQADRAAKKAKRKAKRYEKKGKKAYAKGRWDDAIAAFELAHLAWPRPRHLFNIGRCWEKKGDLFTAMSFIERYVKAVGDEEEREDADEVYSILRSKLLRTSGEVVLRSDPSEATVTLIPEEGDRRTGTTPWVVWLPAGTWKVRVALQDHGHVEEELVVPIGGTIERTYELAPAGAGAEPEAAPGAGEAGDDAGDGWDDAEAEALAGPDLRAEEGGAGVVGEAGGEGGGAVGAWVAAGAGAALLAGGTAFGLLGRQANDDLERFAANPGTATEVEAREAREASDRHALTANVLLGAGVVAVGVGVWLLLAADGPEPATGGLRPWVEGPCGGLAWTGAW